MTTKDLSSGEQPTDPEGYAEALEGVKRAIAQGHATTMRAANTALLETYWQIGAIILDRQRNQVWGAGVLRRLSSDLRSAYPGRRGFSPTNLDYMRRFAAAYPDGRISQQAIGRVGWGAATILLDKVDDASVREFYAQRATAGAWSQSVLRDRIAGQLHLREGAAPSTFARTLPEHEQDAARQLARDPWLFDFLRLDDDVAERDVEQALVDNLAEVLVELGAGFAYMGRQFRLVVGGDEFFLDLLFYHVRLHRYVVFELKLGRFLAEHAGKLNLYLSAVDETVRDRDVDGDTIGVLLVTERNDQVVEYTLRGIDRPMAVGRYAYRDLPADLRSQLPDAATLTKGVAAAADRTRRQLGDDD